MPMKAPAALLVALLVMIAAHTALAQSAQKPNGTPPPPTPLRLSTPALSPFAASPSTYAPHYTSPLRGRRSPSFRGLSPFLPGYGYAAPYSAGPPPSESSDASSGQLDASGSIYLDVEPRTAQVYVDGFYIGTVDDFRRTGVTLPAGRHWIDVRASGYEPQTVPVNIAAGQPTRYRSAMTAVRTPAANAIAPRGPETMYVIPGCYAGNRPPRESSLARGCDIARLYVLTDPH
jgi:PEGA domain